MLNQGCKQAAARPKPQASWALFGGRRSAAAPRRLGCTAPPLRTAGQVSSRLHARDSMSVHSASCCQDCSADSCACRARARRRRQRRRGRKRRRRRRKQLLVLLPLLPAAACRCRRCPAVFLLLLLQSLLTLCDLQPQWYCIASSGRLSLTAHLPYALLRPLAQVGAQAGAGRRQRQQPRLLPVSRDAGVPGRGAPAAHAGGWPESRVLLPSHVVILLGEAKGLRRSAGCVVWRQTRACIAMLVRLTCSPPADGRSSSCGRTSGAAPLPAANPPCLPFTSAECPAHPPCLPARLPAFSGCRWSSGCGRTSRRMGCRTLRTSGSSSLVRWCCLLAGCAVHWSAALDSQQCDCHGKAVAVQA